MNNKTKESITSIQSTKDFDNLNKQSTKDSNKKQSEVYLMDEQGRLVDDKGNIIQTKVITSTI